MITALVLAAMIGQAPQPDPPAKVEAKPTTAGEQSKKSPRRRVEMFPEPNWVPTPGDRVEVILDWAPASTDLDAIDDALNAIEAKDRTGLAELIESKRIDYLAKGTKVLVLANSRPQTIPSPARSIDFRDFARQAPTPQPDFSKLPVEVRILEGELAGRKRYIPEMFIAKLIAGPNAPVRRTRPRLVRTPDSKPEAAKGFRAATLLQSARNLEKTGKLDGASEFYRQVIKDFPDSVEAKTAAERLRSLGKK
jgi:hypothetical protein